MDTAPDPSAEAPSPKPGALRGIALGVVLGWLATAAGLVLLLVLVAPDAAPWWRGLRGATAVSGLAAGLSLVPIAWGLRGSVYRLAGASLAAGGVRTAVSLAGGLLATRVGGYPHLPTLLLIVPFYFVLLAVEAALVARSMGAAGPATAAVPKPAARPEPESSSSSSSPSVRSSIG